MPKIKEVKGVEKINILVMETPEKNDGCFNTESNTFLYCWQLALNDKNNLSLFKVCGPLLKDKELPLKSWPRKTEIRKHYSVAFGVLKSRLDNYKPRLL